jgi:hypothetical protein
MVFDLTRRSEHHHQKLPLRARRGAAWLSGGAIGVFPPLEVCATDR